MAEEERNGESPRSWRTEPVPQRITTLPPSQGEDLRFRQRRYLISMGVRTACFIAAIFVGDNWFRWVLILAALVLPYISVVLANSETRRSDDRPVKDPKIRRHQLGHHHSG